MARTLEDQLVTLLAPHAGETDQNEGAVETLARLLEELKSLRKHGKKARVFAPEQIRYIRESVASKAKTQKELAKEFDVSQSTISSIILRETWTHIP